MLGLKYIHLEAGGFMKKKLYWLLKVHCNPRDHLPEVIEFASQILSKTWSLGYIRCSRTFRNEAIADVR